MSEREAWCSVRGAGLGGFVRLLSQSARRQRHRITLWTKALRPAGRWEEGAGRVLGAVPCCFSVTSPVGAGRRGHRTPGAAFALAPRPRSWHRPLSSSTASQSWWQPCLVPPSPAGGSGVSAESCLSSALHPPPHAGSVVLLQMTGPPVSRRQPGSACRPASHGSRPANSINPSSCAGQAAHTAAQYVCPAPVVPWGPPARVRRCLRPPSQRLLQMDGPHPPRPVYTPLAAPPGRAGEPPPPSRTRSDLPDRPPRLPCVCVTCVRLQAFS